MDFLLIDSCFKVRYRIGIPVNQMHRCLTISEDFLLFSVNAVQHLFPESVHESVKLMHIKDF